MKELNFEQMENVQGGWSCFFAVPYALTALFNGTLFVDPIYGWGYVYNCLT